VWILLANQEYSCLAVFIDCLSSLNSLHLLNGIGNRFQREGQPQIDGDLSNRLMSA
jgi:hypothetical protein